MFKTFDGDSFGEKIGFSKRPFAPWSSDIAQATTDVDGFFAKVKAGFKTAFVVPKGENDGLLTLLQSNELDDAFAKFNEDTKNGTAGIAHFMEQCTDNSFKKYIESVEDGKYTVQGYTKYVNESNAALKATSLSSQAAAAGMKALAIAGNMATAMIAAFAIQKLAEGIDYIIHEEEKLAEKSSTLRQEYKSLSDEIASTEDQLKTMGDRIRELEGLKAPSLADENELARLKESNAELERQKTLKEQLLNIAKLEAEKAAVQTISTISDNGKNPGYISNISGEMKGNRPSNKIDFAKEQMVISDDYKAKIEDAQNQQLALGEITAETQAEYNKLQQSIDAYAEKQSDVNKNVVESVSFLNEQKQGLTTCSTESFLFVLKQQLKYFFKIRLTL